MPDAPDWMDDGYGGGFAMTTRWGRRVDALAELCLDVVGGDAEELDRVELIRLARTIDRRPVTYRHHADDADLEDCMCEEPSWVCPSAKGAPLGDYWHLDASFGALEDCYLPPEDAS